MIFHQYDRGFGEFPEHDAICADGWNIFCRRYEGRTGTAHEAVLRLQDRMQAAMSMANNFGHGLSFIIRQDGIIDGPTVDALQAILDTIGGPFPLSTLTPASVVQYSVELADFLNTAIQLNRFMLKTIPGPSPYVPPTPTPTPYEERSATPPPHRGPSTTAVAMGVGALALLGVYLFTRNR
jgi:hypothetical protein